MNLKNLIKPTKFKRFLFFFMADIIIFSLSLYLSFLLRFDFNIPERYLNIILEWILFISIIKLSLFFFFKIYNFNWRFVGLTEFIKILMALTLSFLITFPLNIYLQITEKFLSIPKTVLIIDLFISLILVSILRISKRIYLEFFYKSKKGKNAIIIGAGSTGERIARELKRNPDYNPVCFIDDDNMKLNTYIHSIPVIGKLENLKEIVKNYHIEAVIIAIPSLTHKELRKIFDRLTSLGIKDIKIVPSINKLPSNTITIKDLKELSIEDLLSREQITIETDKIKEFLQNKIILVSGSAGSIGSEIVRQLIEFSPNQIIALEIDETELHNLNLELVGKLKEKNVEFVPIVGDIRDRKKLERIF